MFSFVGDTILDPFAGSGTTIKAAKDLNRNSVGIDIQTDYLKIMEDKVGFSQQTLANKDLQVEVLHLNKNNEIKKYIDEQSKQQKRQSVIKAIRSKVQRTLYNSAPHSHPAVNNGVSLGSC